MNIISITDNPCQCRSNWMDIVWIRFKFDARNNQWTETLLDNKLIVDIHNDIRIIIPDVINKSIYNLKRLVNKNVLGINYLNIDHKQMHVIQACNCLHSRNRCFNILKVKLLELSLAISTGTHSHEKKIAIQQRNYECIGIYK